MPVVPKRAAGNAGAGAGAASAAGGWGVGGAKGRGTGSIITPYTKKTRETRSAFTRAVDRLRTWRVNLSQNNTSLFIFPERSRFRRSVWRLIRRPPSLET